MLCKLRYHYGICDKDDDARTSCLCFMISRTFYTQLVFIYLRGCFCNLFLNSFAQKKLANSQKILIMFFIIIFRISIFFFFLNF